MKRSTALGHLLGIAELASERLRLRDTDIGWPVEELWVDGDLLGFADPIDAGSVIIVLDVPVEEVPWLAINRTGEWVGDQLRLRKRPLRWCYRPLAWPAWNHEHRRLVRYWSAGVGLDNTVIDALRARRFECLDIVEPAADVLASQLRAELTLTRLHLREMITRYWDCDWRREHQGHDESPEDHLWRAAAALSQMQDAVDGLET